MGVLLAWGALLVAHPATQTDPVPLHTPLHIIGWWSNFAMIECVLAVAVSAIGVWAASRVATYLHSTDPQIVVVDEVAGQLIAYLGPRHAAHHSPLTGNICLLGLYTFSSLRYLEAVSRATSRISARRPGHHGGRLDRGRVCGAGALVVRPVSRLLAMSHTALANDLTPRIDSITPAAAIPGGEIAIHGSGFGSPAITPPARAAWRRRSQRGDRRGKPSDRARSGRARRPRSVRVAHFARRQRAHARSSSACKSPTTCIRWPTPRWTPKAISTSPTAASAARKCRSRSTKSPPITR